MCVNRYSKRLVSAANNVIVITQGVVLVAISFRVLYSLAIPIIIKIRITE